MRLTHPVHMMRFISWLNRISWSALFTLNSFEFVFKKKSVSSKPNVFLCP
jgi:hypothetical protein